jgi:selenocysteine lyase/cysteine desulfurase
VTGLVSPIKALAEMAHRKGLLFSVDAAHALGMLDLNMHDYGIDHYSAAGQKWLMAGTGKRRRLFQEGHSGRVWCRHGQRERRTPPRAPGSTSARVSATFRARSAWAMPSISR